MIILFATADFLPLIQHLQFTIFFFFAIFITHHTGDSIMQAEKCLYFIKICQNILLVKVEKMTFIRIYTQILHKKSVI